MQLCGRDCLLMRLLLLVFLGQTDVTQPAGVHVETNREPFWCLGSLVMKPSVIIRKGRQQFGRDRLLVWLLVFLRI